MSTLPLPTPILSQPEAIKELLQLAEISRKGEDGGVVREWCKDVERLTTSLSSPNFKTIKLLFGKSRAEPIYSLFPTAALAVTAAFIRTVSTNRLGKYVSRPLSDLTPAELKMKNGWEDALADIIGSIADWCEWSEDKKAKSYVGQAVYPSIGMLLSNTSSKRLGDPLKKAVLEIFESTLAETRSNRALFLDASQGVMGPRKLGDLLLAKPVHQASHLLTLDIVAHCLPKGGEERKDYAETIFRSLFVVDVREALETLLIGTSRSEFIQTRPKILKVLAKFDIDRLQLFPLLSAARSSEGTTQLLASKEDQSLIKKALKFVYLDSTSVIFSYSVDDAEKTVAVPFDAIVATKFDSQVNGDDQTTTLTITDESGETFKYKLKCPQATIQRVCASRPFKTAVEPPSEDLRSFHRASTMEATGITLRSPEMVKRSVPPAERLSQRPASVAPSNVIEQEEEEVGESSQAAVRSQKERIEVMEGFTVPSQSPESLDGTSKSTPKDAGLSVSPTESKPTKSKSDKRPSSKRVAALVGTSEPLSKELFGDSDSELSTPGSKEMAAIVASKSPKRKRVELDEGDEDQNADGGGGGDATVVNAPTPKKKKTRKNEELPPPTESMDLDDDDEGRTQPSSFPPPPPRQSIPKHKYGTSAANRKKPSSKTKSTTSKRDSKTRSPSNHEAEEPDPYDELPTAASEPGLVNPIASQREQKKQPAKSKVVKPPVAAKGRVGGKRKVDEDEEEQDVESQLSSTPPPKKSTTTAGASKKKSKKAIEEEEEEPPKEKSKIKIKRGGAAGAAAPSGSTKKEAGKEKKKQEEKEVDTSVRRVWVGGEEGEGKGEEGEGEGE
ncbi:hypothetical protein BDY24DRAFT_280317 [Mrakia frigida]|uniref:uncharacterized protein n=1 Tax=Mrakia frigida TaxID=29902 RepID=UPI003FCC0562